MLNFEWIVIYGGHFLIIILFQKKKKHHCKINTFFASSERTNLQ